MGRQDFETETLLAIGGFPDSTAYRTAGDGCVYEEGDRTAPLTTATDPNVNIVVFDTTQVTSKLNRSNPQIGDPCHPLSAEGHAPAIAIQNATRGKDQNGLGISDDGLMYTLDQGSQHGVAIGLDEEHNAVVDGYGTMKAREHGGGFENNVMTPSMAVRRLLPVECERLQGFPDNFTMIDEKTSDSPRYRALGNSMAVPVMRWLGERIQMVEDICQ